MGMSDGNSFREFLEQTESLGSDSPVLGGTRQAAEPSFEDIRVRYLVANMSDAGDAALVEQIMTASLRCQNTLARPGDTAVFKEESTWDKAGNYLVALKYATVEEPKA